MMRPNLWNLQLFASKGQALSLQPTCCGYCDFRKDQWQNMWSLVCETPHKTPTFICDGAWESEQKGTSAHLLRLLPQHRFRISQKLDAGCGSAIVSQPCPQSEAWVALETEESVDVSRNVPTAEIYASLRFLFLTPPLGTFDLIMKSWQVEPVLYHLTSEVPQWKASICAAHQAPWG